MRRTLFATALGAALAGPAGGAEYTSFMQVHLTPRDAQGAPGCTTPALLNMPATWRTGDAVVVMLTAEPLHNATRDPLIAALLAEGAAVLEVSPAIPAACIEEEDPAIARIPTMADALDTLFGGLVASRREAGGGLVVAIGYGPGGGAALAAAEEEQAARRLGPDGPRFAAALALGDGPAAMHRGGPQPAAEHAGPRLALLCEALARMGTDWGAASARPCMAALAAEAPRGRRPPP